MVAKSSLVVAPKAEKDSLSLSVESKAKAARGPNPTGRSRVLTRQIDFDLIRREGRKINCSRWLVMFYRENDLGHLRYGFSISRKVGKAVTRNRLKRWSREFLRQKIKEGKDCSLDAHLVFRPAVPEFYRELEHAEFTEKMESGFAKLCVADEKTKSAVHR